MLLNVIIEKDQYGYFARILELEGCVSQGNTYEEALINIKEAGELYLESLENKEKSIIENKTTSIIPMVLANAWIANSVICEDTVKLEKASVAVLSGNSEVGKSFLALKVCANAINDGLKPFFWSIEDKNQAILERIKNIENFYPFNKLELEFSNELPKIDKEPMDSLKKT